MKIENEIITLFYIENEKTKVSSNFRPPGLVIIGVNDMSKHVIVTPPEIYTTYILSVLSKRKEDPPNNF